jgi:hypothetical protein
VRISRLELTCDSALTEALEEGLKCTIVCAAGVVGATKLFEDYGFGIGMLILCSEDGTGIASKR